MGQLLSAPMLLAGLILMWAAYHYDIPSGNFGPTPVGPGSSGADAAEQGSPSRQGGRAGKGGGGAAAGAGGAGGRGSRQQPSRGATSHGGSVR